MQPKGSFLPELYLLRHEPKARPIGRAGHITIAKTLRRLLDPPLELGAIGKRLRLVRSPRADLAVTRAGGKVSVSLVVCYHFNYALNADLPVE